MLYTSRLTIPTLCPLMFKNTSIATEDTFYPNALCYTQKWTPNDSIKVQVWINDAASTEIFALECYDEFNVFRGAVPFMWDTLSEGYDYANAIFPCTELYGLYEFRITAEETRYFNWGDVTTPVIDEYYVWGHNLYKYTGGTVDDSDEWILTGAVELITYSLSDMLTNSWPCEIGNHTDTVYFMYGNTTNNFETVFGDFDYNTFTFRVEGGFIPDGFTPKVDISLFTNQNQEDTLTYAMPYSTHTLCIGDNMGVPWWILEKVNSIFCCDIVLTNLIQYTRTGDIDIEWTENKTGIGKLELKPVTNRMTQNVDGDIIITDENYIPISNEDDKVLIL